MAVVRTPVAGFSGVVVGVHFVEGMGETEDPAALLYFEGQGYGIEHEEPAEGTPMTAEEIERHRQAEGTPGSGITAPAKYDASRSAGSDASLPPASATLPALPGALPAPALTVGAGKARPKPQDNKATWFEYLGTVKSGHALTLEATKAEIIAAIDSK